MADNDIDVKIVIVHNSILGMVGQWQRLFYSHHYSASELKGKTDFVRLKEVSLEYTFARQFLRRTPVRNLSLKLQAQNLMLLYSDSRLRGDDPEYMYLSSMVPPKQLILTLRVGL